MDSYSALGKYYDRLIEYPYQQMLTLATQKHKCGKALDLFCGTGRFTMLLASAGFITVGSDLSHEMLNVATTQSRKQGLNIVYKNENALNFSFAEPFDLITATSDGLNYLRKEELSAFFNRVWQALKVGGRFVFDISSYYKLSEILANNFFFEDYEDLTFFWQNTYRKRDDSVKFELTFFEKQSDGRFVRSDETQRQYAHKTDFIKGLALSLGFDVIKILDEKFDAPKPKSERIFFVLERI